MSNNFLKKENSNNAFVTLRTGQEMFMATKGGLRRRTWLEHVANLQTQDVSATLD